MRKLVLLAAAIAVLVGGSTALAGSAGVNITATGFTPQNPSVQAGDSITWTNSDVVRHRVVVSGPSRLYGQRLTSPDIRRPEVSEAASRVATDPAVLQRNIDQYVGAAQLSGLSSIGFRLVQISGFLAQVREKS